VSVSLDDVLNNRFDGGGAARVAAE
jgi:hypothetical protein